LVGGMCTASEADADADCAPPDGDGTAVAMECSRDERATLRARWPRAVSGVAVGSSACRFYHTTGQISTKTATQTRCTFALYSF
jgi:hypothetical protein